MPGYQARWSNMATGGGSAQSNTEEDATELQFPKGLDSPVAFSGY